MVTRLALLILLLACAAPVLRAEEGEDPDAFAKEHLEGLSGERALELVKELAAPAMKGRKTGTAGGEAVENWMLNKMAEFGLHPEDAGGTYLEPFTLQVDGKRAKGHNALGGIKGRDADLVHEVILVTASMDGPGFAADGTALPGADANASGAAVLIHLADVLTSNRLRPKRTVIFCGFGGSYAGFVGSRELAARYPFRGDVVAVLDINRIGLGEPVAVVRGMRTFPKVGAILASAIPAAMENQVVSGPPSGPGGDDWAFAERGLAAFSVTTRGEHPHAATAQNAASAIKPACLNAGAQAAGRLLLALAMHPTTLHDPKAVAQYLVREGPRFVMGAQQEAGPALVDPASGKGIALPKDGRELLASNLDGALWTIAPTEAGGAAWAKVALQANKDDASFALIRVAAEAEAAWRDHQFGLIAYAACVGDVKQRLALLEGYAKAEIRIVAPWSAMSDAERTPAVARELAAACARLRLIPDISVLGPEGWKVARAALGDAPACALMLPEHLAKAKGALAAMGPETLIMAVGSPAETLAPALAKDAPPTVLLDLFAERGLEALHAWGMQQPEGWALPGTPQRAKIRAVLGGNLLTWLAKAEKK